MSWNRLPVLSLVSGPNPEPVDLEEAKLYLRVDADADDDLIEALIHTARMWVESYTGRALITQTFDQKFRGWPSASFPLVLAKAPVASVTSVTYIDADENAQTLNSNQYVLRSESGPTAGRALLEVSKNFSAVTVSNLVEYPVIVRTVCGYGNQSTIPQGIKSAILLMLGDLYEQRQETIAGTITSRTQTTVERLLSPYRLIEAR